MQTRFSDEKAVRPSVCLSVRPSVKRVNCDETEERPVQIILYNTKKNWGEFSEKNGWWGATPSTWNFGSTGSRWNKIADFEPIFARKASAVTPS